MVVLVLNAPTSGNCCAEILNSGASMSMKAVDIGVANTELRLSGIASRSIIQGKVSQLP